jgi:cytochrome c5
MSDTQQHEAHEEHSSAIKTPKQLITIIVLALVVPIIVIIMLVNMVAASNAPVAGSDALGPEATAKRIAPVARLEIVDARGPKVFKTGDQVYKAVCSGCHQAGVAGAHKFGDAVSWAVPIKTGLDAMVASVVKGKNAMPPKGGNPSLDDFEITRAVVYMTNNAGASFPEPVAPASPAK